MSGTVNAARLAAQLVDVPVHVVDSGTASFGVTACLWHAADVVAAGGSAAEAAPDAGVHDSPRAPVPAEATVASAHSECDLFD